MRILPKTPAQQVVRLTSLVPAWAERPDAIGLSPERVAQLRTLLAQARAAQMAAYQARDAARAATNAFEEATAELAHQASVAIGLIKTAARSDAQPVAVLAQAHLPVPKVRGRIGRPGTPTNFSFTLRPTGSLHLEWECENPRSSAGTVYTVRRRIEDAGEFEHLGTRGLKDFSDTTIPVGTKSVTYEITAIRSTARGMPGRFFMQFGSAAASARKSAA